MMFAIDFQFKVLTTIKKNTAIYYVKFEFNDKSLHMKNDSDRSLCLTHGLTGDCQTIVYIIVINIYYLNYNKITKSILFKHRCCVNNFLFYIFFFRFSRLLKKST